MTTISHLNVVVQQGDSARDAQNIKSQPQDHSQMTPAEQVAKETAQRETVNESEGSERLKTEQEKSESRERERKEQERRKKKQQEDEEDPDGTGRLLDTIA